MHREILQGEALDIIRSMPAGSVDGVVTDPPYSSGGATSRQRVTDNAMKKYISSEHQHRYPVDFDGDARDQRSWTTWCEMWLTQCRRVTRRGGVVACFTDWRQLPSLTDALQAAGWTWRGNIVWDKTEGVRPQRGRPRAQAEYVVWGSNGPLPRDRNAPIIQGVIRSAVPKNKLHPCEKSVEMLRVLVQIVERGGTVLDPFAGAGSVGVASVLEGHPYIGIECVPHYAAIAEQRLQEAAA